jgi:hypothetical protein
MALSPRKPRAVAHKRLRRQLIGLLDELSSCAETIRGLLGPNLQRLLTQPFGKVWCDHVPEERRFRGDHAHLLMNGV